MLRSTLEGNKVPEELERFWEALDQAFVQTRGRSATAIVHYYEQLQPGLVKAVGRVLSRLEARRRIAERVFCAVTAKHRRLAVARRQFDPLRRLGFRNLEKRATYTIIYARYLVDNGQSAEVIGLLRSIERALRRRLGKDPRHVLYRDLLKGPVASSQTTRPTPSRRRGA